MNKIIRKKSIEFLSLKVSFDELTNNQSETKAKINSQSQARPQKITKKDFKVRYLSFSHQVKMGHFKVQRLKRTSFQVKRIA